MKKCCVTCTMSLVCLSSICNAVFRCVECKHWVLHAGKNEYSFKLGDKPSVRCPNKLTHISFKCDHCIPKIGDLTLPAVMFALRFKKRQKILLSQERKRKS